MIASSYLSDLYSIHSSATQNDNVEGLLAKTFKVIVTLNGVKGLNAIRYPSTLWFDGLSSSSSGQAPRTAFEISVRRACRRVERYSAIFMRGWVIKLRRRDCFVPTSGTRNDGT